MILGLVVLAAAAIGAFALFATGRSPVTTPPAIPQSSPVAAVTSPPPVVEAPPTVEPPPVAVVEPPPAPVPAPPEPTPEPPPKAVDPRDFPRDRWQALKGCVCRVDLDGIPGEESVQLAAAVLGSGTTITSAGTRKETEFAFAVLAGSGPPAVLTLRPDTAPPSVLVGSRMAIGVACDGGNMLVASQSSVTAWTLPGGERAAWSERWTTPLDGTFPRPVASGEDIDVTCVKLPVSRGRITVAREADRDLRLSVRDGSAQ